MNTPARFLLATACAALLSACSIPAMPAPGKADFCFTRGGGADFTLPDDPLTRSKLAAWQQHCEAQSYSYVFMDYAPRAVLLYARDRIHLVEFHDRSIIVEPRGSIVGYSRDRTPEDDAFYAYLMSLTPEKKK